MSRHPFGMARFLPLAHPMGACNQGSSLIAVCRWVDTQLEPPNRRLCLKFWDVPSNKRQVRFVSGLVGQLCRPESRFYKG